MYDISPGWHTTIQPVYYLSAKLLTILAILMLVWLIIIKVLKIKKQKYQGAINIANLIFCIISSVLLISYVFELAIAFYSGYVYEQFAFFNRALGSYWILFLGLMWIPLLLTQLFWRKKNRININLALFIIFTFNIHLWFERIYIIITSLIRN